MSYVLEYHYNTIEKKEKKPKTSIAADKKWLCVFASVLVFYSSILLMNLLIVGQDFSQLTEAKNMFILP